MSSRSIDCPRCGEAVALYRNPAPTVDIVISCRPGGREKGVVLIRRRYPPLGWALPGGFIDYGESAEEAARREAKEETGLDVHLQGRIGVYSRPDRDPRKHTMSVVFAAVAYGVPRAGDDAAEAKLFTKREIPADLCFDHRQILTDYFAWLDKTKPALR